MKYLFSEIDSVTLTFSDIKTTPDGMEYIRIYFEKPIERGFAFVESTLPALNIVEAENFTAAEITELLNYAERNAFLVWDMARDFYKEYNSPTGKSE